jgi:hypothetical protein
LVAGLEQPIAARRESRSTEKYGRESFGIANPQVTPLTRRCWKSCTKRTDQPMGCLSNDQSRGMLTQQRCNTTGLTDRKKPVSAWGSQTICDMAECACFVGRAILPGIEWQSEQLDSAGGVFTFSRQQHL